ncbi:MAG: MATE family efflux transporter [Christensenellales bacterium]
MSAGFGAPVLAGMGLCARAIMPFTSAVIGFGQGFQPVCGAAFGATNGALPGSAYRFCQRVAIALFAGGRSRLSLPLPRRWPPAFAHDAQIRRGRAPRAPPAKRRLSRAERRHFDDHAHAGHGAHPPRLARRHQPSGALLPPPAGGFCRVFSASGGCLRARAPTT